MDSDNIFDTSDEDESARGSTEDAAKADNPFSFRRFLHPDVQVSAGVAEDRLAEKAKSETEGEGGAENPFSFKKWIKASDGTQTTKQPAHVSQSDVRAGERAKSSAVRSATNMQTEHSRSKWADEVGAAEALQDVAALPDFLEDGALRLTERNEPDLTLAASNSKGNEDFRETRETKTVELQATMQRLKQELAFERRRSEKFAAKLSAFEAKERSETSALESAIAQIEARLGQVTGRCELAEARALQLERENATLRLQLANFSAAPSRDDLARHRCEQAATGLLAAANEGETVLKSLLLGVEKLRVCAKMVNDVYRFEEEPFESA